MTKKRKEKTIVLIDAHAVIHRAYHALPPFSSSKGEPTGALYGLVTMLLKAINDLEPDLLIACFDVPEPTYRHKAYDAYKAGRVKAEDDLKAQLQRAKDVFLAFGIPIYESVGFEADDIIGTITEILKKEKDLSIIIASGDMDTLQLVDKDKVRVFTLKKGIKDTIIYNEKAVLERFGFSPELLPDFKGLCGDPSDNIPGIKGIGEKTAKSLIASFGELEEILKTAEEEPEKIKKAGVTERIINLLLQNKEEARFSKMLATIRKDAPLDFSLPQNNWKDSVDAEKVNKLFSELDFRSLIGRFKETVGLPKKDQSEKNESSKITEKQYKELKVASWLLNSELTQPEKDDILSLFATSDLTSAYSKAMKALQENELNDVFERIERPFIEIVEKMSKRGIKIDTKELKEIKKEYEQDLKKEEKRIKKQAGSDFNINSPQQLGEVLFNKLGLHTKNLKKTSTGSLSTRESELVKLKDKHPIIEEILTYREINKLLTTYIEPLLSMVDENEVIHAEFLQTGTTTGRISSSNPNLQNIPISTERGRKIRNVFVAREGYTLVACDYSQIELRVAAILSGDEKLVAVFKEGGDIHSAVASEVFEVPEQEVDKEMRRKAKVINFGIMYGMGVNALKANLDTSQAEAREFLNKYFERFSGLAKYIEEVKRSAHDLGYTKTLFGRRRYVAGLNSSVPYIRAGAERAAVNAPIQGTAADIIKRAAVLVRSFLQEEKKEDKAFLLLQVHDELVFEVLDGLYQDFIHNAKAIMESVLVKEGYKEVPLEVNVEKGKSWGKMDKFLK
ncbi:MAG: DNA polymerase [Candidatus Paceibacterota bacterium]